MKIVGFLIVVLPLMVATTGYAASSSCSKPHSKLEKIICSDAKLAALNESLDKSYEHLLNITSNADTEKSDQADFVKADQAEWLDDETQRAFDDELSIDVAKADYVRRIRSLESRSQGVIFASQPKNIWMDSCISIPGQQIHLGCRVEENVTLPGLSNYVFQLQRSGPNICASSSKPTKDKPTIFNFVAIAMGPVSLSDGQEQTKLLVSGTENTCGTYKISYFNNTDSPSMILIYGGMQSNGASSEADWYSIYAVERPTTFVLVDQNSILAQQIPPDLMIGISGIHFDYHAMTAKAPLYQKASSDYLTVRGCAYFVFKLAGNAFVPISTKIVRTKDPSCQD